MEFVPEKWLFSGHLPGTGGLASLKLPEETVSGRENLNGNPYLAFVKITA